MAAALFAFSGIGGVLTLSPLIVWVAFTDRFVYLFGVNAIGSGPLGPLGPRGVAGIGVALVGSCIAESVTARWLWRGERRGGLLGLILAPISLAFAIGYDFPAAYVLVPLRTLLLLLGRRRDA